MSRHPISSSRAAPRARRLTAVGAAAITAAIALAGCGGERSPEAAAATAKATANKAAATGPAPRRVYVDKDSVGGACADNRSATSAANPATPWCSLDRALRAAPRNATVSVRRGSYPPLIADNVRRRGWLTIASAPGEVATLDSFQLRRTSWVRFRHLRITGHTNLVDFGDRHIEMLDCDVTVSTHVRPSTDLRFQGNTFHDLPGPPANSLDGVALWIVNGTSGQTTNVVIRRNRFSRLKNDAVFTDGTRVLIEDNVFEHIQSPDNNWAHADVIQTQGVFDITIRRNFGTDNDSGILNSAARSHGWVIEDNLFIRSGSQPVQLDNKVQDLRMVNNTFWQSGAPALLRWDPAAPRNPHRWIVSNNIATRLDIDPKLNVTQDHNLVLQDPFHNGPQGEGSRVGVSPRFIDPAAGDYRLAQGSPGVDAGNGSRAPARDRAGNRRFDDPATPDRGTGRPAYADVGAYEFRPDAVRAAIASGRGE